MVGRRLSIPGCLAVCVLVGCGGSSDGPNAAPNADQLPLASGVHLVTQEVRAGDDNTHTTFLMVDGPQGKSRKALIKREVTFLRANGWTVDQRHGDGAQALESRDKGLWTDFGFVTHSYCSFRHEGSALGQGIPFVCASLGTNHQFQ